MIGKGSILSSYTNIRSVVFSQHIFLSGKTLRMPFLVVLKLTEVPESLENGKDFRHSLPHLLPSARAILLQSVSYTGLACKALLVAVENFLQTTDKVSFQRRKPRIHNSCGW